MNSLPIGVFDSGLGGLTAVKELKKLLPGEDILYFGDTGRVPYGNRSHEAIYKYAVQDMRFLLQKRVKMIIAACGTVSSVAESAGDNLTVPFTGVVRPASMAAAERTKNQKIGVIATEATISSGSYVERIREYNPEADVLARSCPLFVPLVESGFISPDDPIARLTVERYLQPFISEGVDTLILGCTHYPILKPIITEVVGGDVLLIDSGQEAAKYAQKVLTEKNMLAPKTEKGQASFFVSDRPEGFERVAKIFLGEDIQNNVNRVDIDTL